MEGWEEQGGGGSSHDAESLAGAAEGTAVTKSLIINASHSARQQPWVMQVAVNGGCGGHAGQLCNVNTPGAECYCLHLMHHTVLTLVAKV
ncbi:hypothetical protein E2C01_079679 [Portunus trituberculatus]|uniref:Uncharacterized protein n=1 Tax=Portunus trituberculatus TaxID=210409 RepID=A0A5B7IQY7_PORTR|nr:hypothetical protein [Portunus trituberculatus]